MQQFHCVVNTVVALIGACISAFVASAYFENQFDMVHVQVSGLRTVTSGSFS